MVNLYQSGGWRRYNEFNEQRKIILGLTTWPLTKTNVDADTMSSDLILPLETRCRLKLGYDPRLTDAAEETELCNHITTKRGGLVTHIKSHGVIVTPHSDAAKQKGGQPSDEEKTAAANAYSAMMNMHVSLGGEKDAKDADDLPTPAASSPKSGSSSKKRKSKEIVELSSAEDDSDDEEPTPPPKAKTKPKAAPLKGKPAYKGPAPGSLGAAIKTNSGKNDWTSMRNLYDQRGGDIPCPNCKDAGLEKCGSGGKAVQEACLCRGAFLWT